MAEYPTLRFDSDLVLDLLYGGKTATVRYDLDPEIEPGTQVALSTAGRGTKFAKATVEDVIRTELSDALDAIDEAGHGHNADSFGDLWESMNGYYPVHLGLSTLVSVVLLEQIVDLRVEV